MIARPLAFTEQPLTFHMLSQSHASLIPPPLGLPQHPHSAPFPSKCSRGPFPPLDLCISFPWAQDAVALGLLMAGLMLLLDVSANIALLERLSWTTPSKQLSAMTTSFPADESLPMRTY